MLAINAKVASKFLAPRTASLSRKHSCIRFIACAYKRAGHVCTVLYTNGKYFTAWRH
jgi:hypothetical protein